MTRRRRFALWLGEWLRAIAWWLDLSTAPKYDPATHKHMEDVTDEEWEAFYATIRGDKRP